MYFGIMIPKYQNRRGRDAEEDIERMANALKMSDATILGIHAMAYLADHRSDGEPQTHSVHEIASYLNVSEAHLAKVLQRLAHVGHLRSTRGPKGGFTLAKEPNRITLLDVYEALEGPFKINRCLFSEPICSRADCIMGGLVEKVGTEIRTYLEQTTLATVAEGESCAK